MSEKEIALAQVGACEIRMVHLGVMELSIDGNTIDELGILKRIVAKTSVRQNGIGEVASF